MKNSTAAAGSLAFFAPAISKNNESIQNKDQLYLFTKCTVDIGFAIAVLPVLAVLTVFLFVANKRWNPGGVFFRQVRMGQHGQPFTMWKFRTMISSDDDLRAVDAPLEEDRIPPLGRLLRRTKLDELPNVLNIFSGEMSLVGPRPDAFSHAAAYISDIPHYGKRLVVRPGITGLAQVRGGYADNTRAVQRKAQYDSFYVRNAGLLLDMHIVLSTVAVMISGFGQR